MRHVPRLLAALLVTTTLAYSASAATPAKASESSTYDLLNLFGEVFDRVRSDYVEPVADDKLIESALNGMLTSLDPHSNYLNEKSFADMRIQTKGEFGGLGIEVTMENGLVKVVSPIDDTPAAKAGIKPGDFISEIDSVAVMGLTLQDAVEKMRGTVGSNVKISILREGLKEPLNITIKRDLIKIQSVRSRSEDDVAYLRITSFSENTADAMKAAFEKEKKIIGPKLKGVVLDLRNNPGGLLDQAVEVSDAFLDHGEIVSTRSRKSEDSRRYSAKPGDIANDLPLVVLINEGSASASEIVAGALKDHKRGVVLGVKSFGKGSVQTVIPIENHGAIRLTTARYYTPSGVSIQAKGIVPDIMVEQAKLEPLKANVNFSEESLPGHLINDQSKDEDAVATPVSDTKKDAKTDAKKDGKKDSKDAKKDKDAASDYQLSRALDLIRAVSIYKKVGGDAPLTNADAPVPAATPTPPVTKK
ncbi:MAG: S41 family peptidase [Rickettsiales bacterium]|nr:S41 family peptidase [Rickettsiales bacterium]